MRDAGVAHAARGVRADGGISLDGMRGAEGHMNSMEKQILEAKVIDALETCFDPEIPVNIYELGLVYGIEISDSADVRIKMTLTAPNCPVAASLPLEVESKVKATEGVKTATVELIWDPPWNSEKISESARLQLGMI
jgi:FeS assembly SUF system protein